MIQGSSTDENLYAKCLQYLFLLVKFGNFGRKREPPKSHIVSRGYKSVLVRIFDLPESALAHQREGAIWP